MTRGLINKNQISLTTPQTVIFNDTTRFRVVPAGRRFGKTYLAGAELCNACFGLDKVTGEPNSYKNVIYVSPTFSMAERQMWRWLNRHIDQSLIVSINKSSLTMQFINGSILQLLSAERYENIRGDGYTFAVLDEVSVMKDPDVWTMIIRPALADKEGGCLFIGTPKPGSWFQQLYKIGLSKDNKEWSSHSYTSEEGGNISLKEIAAMKETMTEKQFAQELEGTFQIVGNRVIEYFTEENIKSCQDNGGELVVGMDFNVNPMTAVISMEVGDELHVIKCYKIRDYDTNRLMIDITTDFPGRSIRVYPDPTGRARKTSTIYGATDHTIIEQHGGVVVTPRQVTSKHDAITTLNAMMCNFKKRRRLFIDPSCTELIDDLFAWTYNDKLSGREPDKLSGNDHLCESLYYITYSLFPMREIRYIKELDIN